MTHFDGAWELDHDKGICYPFLRDTSRHSDLEGFQSRIVQVTRSLKLGNNNDDLMLNN
jgi:hypothetical protein